MKVFIVTFLSLTSLGLTCGRSTDSLGVANGTIEEPYRSPWQAKLYLVQSLFFWPCGGTLISRNYVLTAARCFGYQNTYKADGITIELGAWDMSVINDTYRVTIQTNVESVKFHEGYNATTHENDIALIQLPTAIEFTDQIQPAKLANVANISIGDISHISGWQYPFREWDIVHQRLKGGDVTIVNNSFCQDEYPSHVINENVICAAGTVAMCYGDEGSALPINGQIYGIAYGSKEVLEPGEECPIVPNTYIYIPKYLDWIKANSDYQD